MLSTFFTILQIAIGLFLIFIIMLQRGKGGGLVGALGGMGGASAFGPKADIQVLKLTIGLAVAWVVVACTGIYLNRSYNSGFGEDIPVTKKVDKDTDKGAEDVDVPKLDDTKADADKKEAPETKKGASDKSAKDAPAKDAASKDAPVKTDADTSKQPAAPANDAPAAKTPNATDKAPETKK